VRSPNTYHFGAGRDCKDCHSPAESRVELLSRGMSESDVDLALVARFRVSAMQELGMVALREMGRIGCRRDGCESTARANQGAVGPYSSLCVPHAVQQCDADALAYASTTGPVGQHRSTR